MNYWLARPMSNEPKVTKPTPYINPAPGATPNHRLVSNTDNSGVKYDIVASNAKLPC
ncbi:hypothetical protein SAMN05192566_2237 [Methylophilus rhizosphaerae]|uniref:Uncharacterized protein n=1 Tax=Methylophilus rhizosphaerae TaxID=492660 RepID=A0A1G9E969_9PROT|nr:hypothetical protein [Methylophilus rhizosphaerae]SDK72628.1 hypothetical protein SAMN05192566_2237 [Methylophilus rhizosphaerae]